MLCLSGFELYSRWVPLNIVIFRCFLFRHLDLLKHFDIILPISRLKKSSFRPRKTFRVNKTKYANLH